MGACINEIAREASGEQGRASSLFIQSFEKGLKILQAFDRHRSALGLRDLMAVTGLDQSAVQRFVHTLHTLGYLAKDADTRKFSLTPKVLELGFSYLHAHGLIDYAMPILYELNDRWQESTNLTEMLGSDVIYIARVPGRQSIAVDVLLGTRMPAYATAPGRAMLAFMASATVDHVLDRSDLRALTRRTVTSRPDLSAILQEVQRSGYALAVDQCFEADLSVAAPVFDGHSQPIAAVNISVPTLRWQPAAVRKKLAPAVIAAAATISAGHAAWGARRWFAKSLAARASSSPA